MSQSCVPDMRLKTRDLSFLGKLTQAYWANPKSWLLDEFVIENGNVTVSRKNGSVFTAHISEINATFATDNYERREINMRSKSDKTRFKEIPGMLDDDEWNAIIAALNPSKSGIGKLTDGLRALKEGIEERSS